MLALLSVVALLTVAAFRLPVGEGRRTPELAHLERHPLWRRAVPRPADVVHLEHMVHRHPGESRCAIALRTQFEYRVRC